MHRRTPGALPSPNSPCRCLAMQWVAAHKVLGVAEQGEYECSCGASPYCGVQWDRSDCIWFVQRTRGDRKLHGREQ